MKQKDFLEIEGALEASNAHAALGNALGWTLSRNGVVLERNRGGTRLFKSLDSVAVFCAEHGIKLVKVVIA